MNMQKKALYTLLRKRFLSHHIEEIEAWKVEDLRELSTYELFTKLHTLGLSLDEEKFILQADSYSTPELFADFISSPSLAPAEKDQLYLLIFELWRRLLPEKQSLSIFCDEIDHRLALYEEDPVQNESSLQNLLLRLKEILEENVDAGEEPQEIFQNLSLYCASDLETFLYDYISTQLDAKNFSYALELLEDFYPFVKDPLWFDFLKARMLSFSEPHETNLLLKEILFKVKEEVDLDLLLEMCAFLISHGDPHLFQQASLAAFDLIQTEEDFQELLAIVADYYRCLDRDKEEKALQALFAKRDKIALDTPLHKNDKALSSFEAILGKLLNLSP